MRKSSVITIFILLIILILIFLLNKSPNISISKACVKEKCFNLEIAQTPEQRAKGLMYSSSLNKNSGMLFIYPKEQTSSFWMKNTLIPLDMIWINKDKEIVHIQHNALPCTQDPCQTYPSNKKALYVLEINANLSKQYNFNIGDKVQLK